ncbi:MAG TPA: hypothetical protein VFS00_09220 [Polyangiaceae bacterium]|nr:hypothetical protein [Polyangiaceae bacterium]
MALRLSSNQGNAVTRASAYFSKLAAPAPAQQLEVGGCTFTEFSGPVPADPEPPQAGPITVSKAGTALLTLKPSPGSGYYGDSSASEALFAAGERIGFLAAGASVPAFSGEVTAPGPLVVTLPTKPAAGEPVVIDRSQPFEVTWTPGPAGANANLLLLAPSPTPGHSFAARCSVDQSVGKATFAPEGLAIMPAGEGNVRFSAIQKSVVSAGAASVELIVSVGATGPGGAEGMAELPAKFE